MTDTTDLRKLVRKSARKMTLRGYGEWSQGWHIHVNVASELGLDDNEIRNEWSAAVKRARHLRALFGENNEQ